MIKRIWKNKKARTAIKFLTAILTLGIITMLILSGPAAAFSLSLSSDKQNIKSGENVNFDVILNVNAEEFSQLNTLTLVLDGPNKRECVFDISGNKLSSCLGVANITSSITDTGSYGYLSRLSTFGYGTSSGKEIKFTIAINSQGYSQGNYATSIKVVSGNQVIVMPGNSLTITQQTTTTTTHTTSSFYHRENEVERSVSKGTKGVIEINGGEKFTIITESLWHEFQVIDVKPQYVTVRFDNEMVDLKLGELKEFNLNNDESNDIAMNIWFIGNDKAKLYVDAYDAKLVEKKTIKNIPAKYIKPQNDNVQSIQNTNNIQNKSSLFDMLNKFVMIIALVFVNLIVLELIGIVGVMKNRKVKRRMRRTVMRKY